MAMVTLNIDGVKVEVADRTPLIEAAKSVHIEIPTLCYFRGIEPYGVCRICICEIKTGRRTRMVTACNYPVSDGIEVFTRSDRVIKNRKMNLELMLARCPDVEILQKLAKEYGVERVRFEKSDKNCILCGLCVRACSDIVGANVIGFKSHGMDREVALPFDKEMPEICIKCGACAFVCPTGHIKLEDANGYKLRHDELLLGSKKPIHVLTRPSVPNAPVIDSSSCIYFKTGQCKICEFVCDAKAINHEQKEENTDLNVGAVIMSPGYESFDANTKQELGYDRYPNVVSALEFERVMSASGPFSGKILRPYDYRKPKRIAFIQCVGSREKERNYCSSVCCMYATKEAIIAKEHEKDLECTIFFIDLRAFSKGFEAYYERAKELGVRYIRCRPSSIKEVPDTKNLLIQYITESKEVKTDEFDMVVLSTGLCPPKSVREISEKLGIKLNEHNFCHTEIFKPVESTRDGVYVCGPFTEPKDIPETVMQASASASKVLSLLRDVRGALIKPKEYPPEIDVAGQEPRIGVFVCHCGTNIAGVVDVPSVIAYVRTLPNVIYAENNLYTCSSDTQEIIKGKIKEHNLNRVVVASCTPRTHEPLFRNTVREAGLNPYLFEMANIRDQCSWVHMHEPEKATRKAKDLVRMAVAKARLLESLQKGSIGINKSALVIGAGLAGMVSALELSAQGFEVHLVEKEGQPGGNLRRIHYLLNGEKPQEALASLIQRVKADDSIHLYINAKIEGITGSVGNYKTKVSSNGEVKEFEHGVAIVATGAKEYRPKEYLYGEDKRVITQLELEERIAGGGNLPQNIVMIQCVGSRNKEHPYCSRVCCSEAVKNAIKIKEKKPSANVYILYRDIRTYGFKEGYYTKARENGVIFIRYEDDKNPEVASNDGHLKVSLTDPMLKMPLSLDADLLVLSAGTAADEENKTIAQFLKVPLNQDGFFLEAHMKLRPVDFATEGVFLTGLAHSAKSVDESIIQSGAAAARAATILSKDRLDLEANISFVVDENCDGCAYCIEPCPYKALTLIEYMREGAIKKTVELNESLCKGCGTCQATCPKKGIFVKGFKLEQVSAQIEAALQPIGDPSDGK